MLRASLLAAFSLLLTGAPPGGDILSTAAGDLEIAFVGHGSLFFRYGGEVIHVDPFGRLADYSTLPKADLVLITHEHRDHLDPEAIDAVSKGGTVIICNAAAAAKLGPGGIVLANGDRRSFGKLTVEAVPAYNIAHLRDNGKPYHARGNGNGYVLTFADRKVYIAGDTENIPEMKELKDIHVAFLPMNLPYTMTPEMAADAARMVNPSTLYPYHFGDTDTSRIVNLLEGTDIDVRIRPMR